MKPTTTRCSTCKQYLLINHGITACVVCDLMGLWPSQPKGRWRAAQ